MIDGFERWEMPPKEADEWRRRILARQRLLKIAENSDPVD